MGGGSCSSALAWEKNRPVVWSVCPMALRLLLLLMEILNGNRIFGMLQKKISSKAVFIL